MQDRDPFENFLSQWDKSKGAKGRDRLGFSSDLPSEARDWGLEVRGIRGNRSSLRRHSQLGLSHPC